MKRRNGTGVPVLPTPDPSVGELGVERRGERTRDKLEEWTGDDRNDEK